MSAVECGERKMSDKKVWVSTIQIAICGGIESAEQAATIINDLMCGDGLPKDVAMDWSHVKVGAQYLYPTQRFAVDDEVAMSVLMR